MNIYIISFDLVAPGQHYDKIIELIKQYKVWAKLGTTTYLVQTSHSAIEVRDNLKSAIDLNDKLFVGKVMRPAAWSNMSEDVSKWIKEKF